MYIPQKSGHVSHTIKNYVLGELKRYIRYNSQKLSFLKIRTKLFSRLRNCGFKKVWLRKHFATLKYEDRDKLMKEKEPDSSSFSHPACQIVLEKEAKSLKNTRSLLADTVPYQNDRLDINGMMNVFPMEPHRPIGGTISGQNKNHEATKCLPPFKNSVIQESAWETSQTFFQAAEATAAVATKPSFKTMAREENMEENKRRRKMNAAEANLKPSSMYLVLTSYAEPHKAAIKKILNTEKAKLCTNNSLNFFLTTFSLNLHLPTARILNN